MPRGGRLRWITLGLLVATAVPQAEAHSSARPEPFPDRTVQAPPNDHLADAITIDALPFVDEQDGTTYFVKAGGQAGNAGHLVIEAEAVDLSAEAGVFLPFLARNAPIP